jgi:diguanylate cyclase (GGDEF)-like protein
MLLRVKGVKNELIIAFGLIIVANLVFLAYLFPGVSSFFESKSSLPIIVGIIFFLLVVSFVIIIHIIEPIIKISNEAKKMANGEIDRAIELFREDEIGDLGGALNQLTTRIRDNLNQLQNFKQTSETLHLEINKRIDVLANILDISSLIAQNAPVKEIYEASIAKCLKAADMTFGCIFVKEADSGEFRIKHVQGPQVEELQESGLQNRKVLFGDGLLGKAVLQTDIVVIDKSVPKTAEIQDVQKMFLIDNLAIVPISSKGNIFGLLIVGNDEKDFSCSSSECELLKVIAKQVAIAVTNDRVANEIRKLEVIDNLTGLFNRSFITSYLKEEIKKAVEFKRPCSFILLSIDGYDKLHKEFGDIVSEEILVRIGEMLKEYAALEDKAGRFSDNEFALILPGKNKRNSIEIAEKIRLSIELLFSKESEDIKKLTCTGVVTENPLDGMSPEELISKAEKILKEAQKQGGNKIFYRI